MLDETLTKTCIGCGETKPLTAFNKRLQSKLGRASECRLCANARVAKWKRAAHSAVCSKCGVLRPASEFPRNRASRNGLNHWCKPCNNDRYAPLLGSAIVPEGYCASCGRPPSECVFPVSNGPSKRQSSWCIDCHHAFRATLSPEQASREALHWDVTPARH